MLKILFHFKLKRNNSNFQNPAVDTFHLKFEITLLD